MKYDDLEHYRATLEQTPAMIWRTGLDGERTFFNTAWLDFTGRTLAEELGHGWREGLHPDDAETYLATFQAHFAQRVPFESEYRLRRADGHYRHILTRARPYRNAAGHVAGFVGSCVDVDERLRREDEALDDLFEMSLDNVCVAGFDGYFKRVNRAWVQTLGWSADELMSRPIVEFAHPEDRKRVLESRSVLKTGDSFPHVTNRYMCKDGSFRWLEFKAVAHHDRKLIYAVARDVTEQKVAEQNLREAREIQEKLQRQLVFADRMASVGTLAAGVAHEINNPLAYVTTNIDLMIRELDGLGASPPVLKTLGEMAGEAQAGAERIRKIVGGLKTFSRAEEERRAVIDVVPLLEMSINMTFNEIRHRARLIRDFAPIPLVEADDARLGQVFINLLVNAAQALPDGDSASNEIRIATATDELGRAVIEVRDSGCGIPESLLERIFEPFFTTKPIGVGTGLGLSICRNIVVGLGGELLARSEPGRGTTFRIVLPPAGATPVALEADGAAAAPEVTRASVLVVDDEPAIGRVLRRILRAHDVTAVTTAKEALALLESGRNFHIVFSDLMMPVMSGMDFYDELTRRFPQVPERVVFVSGGAFTPRAHAFLDAVPNECLEKPFAIPLIEELVVRFALGKYRR